MAEFGIQGCLATQEADEEEPEVIMETDEVAALKAQLAALQQKFQAAENKIDNNAERIAKNTEIAKLADLRSQVNRKELDQSIEKTPVKTEEPQAPTPDTSQTVKKKVSAPVPDFLFDLILFM